MIKHSEEPLKSIYKDISNGNYTDAVSKAEDNRTDIPESVYHIIYFFIDHINGFIKERDARYQIVISLVNGIEEEAYFLLAETCTHIISQHRLKDALNYSDAIEYLDSALKINPDHVESLLLYGNVLWNQNKITDSIEMLNRAISIDKNAISTKLNMLMSGLYSVKKNIKTKYVLKDLRNYEEITDPFIYKYLEGSLLLQINRYKDAITCFEAALCKTASRQWLVTEIRGRLAGLYLKAKNYVEAQKQLDNLDTSSQFNISLKHKDYNSCLLYAKQGLKECDEYRKIEWQFRIAEILFHLKDYKKAESAIKPVIKHKQYRHSRYKDFYLYGQILFKQQRFKDALKELENAILEVSKDLSSSINEDETSIRLLMADINLRLHIIHQKDRIKAAIKLAKSIKPDSLEHINTIRNELSPGMLLLDSNRTREMKKEIKLLLIIDKTLRFRTDKLSKKLTDSTNKNRKNLLQTQMDILSAASRNGISDDDLLRYLAQLEEYFNKPEEALKILENISPNNINDMILIAICLQKQGKDDEALEKLEEIKANKYINKDQLANVLSTQIDFYKNRIVDNTDLTNIEMMRESFDLLIHNEIARYSKLSGLSGLHSNFHRVTLQGSTLYKYKDYNTNTINSILNNYLYFSTPTQLNDPLDIIIEDIHKSKPEYFEHYKVNPDDFGIFSSTMQNKHSLMWSHYSRDHKGLCIGYRIFSLPEFVGWNNIEYCPSYEEVDDVLAKGGYVINSLSTKTEVWSYEEEIRLFCYKPKNQKIHYSPTPNSNEIGCEISKIILGYKMDSEAKQSIESIVRLLNNERSRTDRPKIKLFETIRSQLYELDLHEIVI